MSYAALYDLPAPAFVPRRRVLRGTRRRGVGDLTTAQLAGSAVTTAGNTVGGILTSLANAAGEIPVAGPIIAGIASILGPIIATFNGCGQTCIQATQYANQANIALQQALNAYMAQPVHYKSVQQATLAQMQAVFDALRQACSNPALGSAGQRCISDRLVEGAVTSWCNGKVGCDWITAYYNPVLNDPNVVADPVSAASLLTSVESGNFLPLALVAALVVGLVIAL